MNGILPGLNTNRLVLKQIEHTNASEILFLRSNKVVNAYVTRPETKNLKEAIAFIDKINNGIEAQDWLFWGIFLKENPKLIGTICLWNFSKDHKTAEVGYDLHPHFHGKGIMNEALVRILGYGLKKLELDQIEAYTHKDNEASKKLLVRNSFIFNEHRFDQENANNIIYTLHKNTIKDH